MTASNFPGRILVAATDTNTLMDDVVQADASTLLRYMEARCMSGNVSPITTREALEAVHRTQPVDAIIPQEAAHIARVMQALRGMISG
ncbi:MAG TPA: hypothetical protein VF681_05785 [Abditibacteriaceae bacterium]|jgi:hypothetical protein